MHYFLTIGRDLMTNTVQLVCIFEAVLRLVPNISVKVTNSKCHSPYCSDSSLMHIWISLLQYLGYPTSFSYPCSTVIYINYTLRTSTLTAGSVLMNTSSTTGELYIVQSPVWIISLIWHHMNIVLHAGFEFFTPERKCRFESCNKHP